MHLVFPGHRRGGVRPWSGVVLLLAALALGAARPATAATVLLDEMTWTEVRDAMRAGRTTIIIPVGGTEQNG